MFDTQMKSTFVLLDIFLRSSTAAYSGLKQCFEQISLVFPQKHSR